VWDNKGVKFCKQSHATYFCEYHVVITTKYRYAWINEGIFAYLELKLREIRKWYPDIVYKAMNQDKDHIHLLISIPPKMRVSDVIRLIKTNTSRELKQKFPLLKEHYYGTDGVWSDGYFVSTVGVNESVIKNYIEHQGQEDSGQAKLVL
jgi:putative transposase